VVGSLFFLGQKLLVWRPYLEPYTLLVHSSFVLFDLQRVALLFNSAAFFVALLKKQRANRILFLLPLGISRLSFLRSNLKHFFVLNYWHPGFLTNYQKISKNIFVKKRRKLKFPSVFFSPFLDRIWVSEARSLLIPVVGLHDSFDLQASLNIYALPANTENLFSVLFFLRSFIRLSLLHKRKYGFIKRKNYR